MEENKPSPTQLHARVRASYETIEAQKAIMVSAKTATATINYQRMKRERDLTVSHLRSSFHVVSSR